MVHRYNPESMFTPVAAYMHGVEVAAGERIIYVAGQVGIRPDGTVPESMEEQTEQVFLNIQAVLRERGMDLEDLVSTQTFIVNKDDIPGYRAVREKVVGSGQDAPKCAAAMITVAGLTQPEWKIEVCAVAAKE